MREYIVTYGDCDEPRTRRTAIVEAPDAESAVEILCDDIAWTIYSVRRGAL